MLDSLDEPNENLAISSKPNALILNAAGYIQTDKFGPVKDKNRLTRISAINLVKPNLPPCLVIHGTNDRSVPFIEAQEFVKKMKSAGNVCEFEILEGGGHVPWFNTKYAQQVDSAYDRFFRQIGYKK
jgi:dipeptidyl aminopeptidase/acylaminoacyl peptidase